MKTIQTPVFTPFKSVLNPALSWNETKLTRTLIRMQESLSVQQTLIAQLEFQVECEGMATLTANMEGIFELAKEQLADCIKVHENTVALFN